MDSTLITMIFLILSGLVIIGVAVWYLNKPKQISTLPNKKNASADGVPTISGKENPPTAGFKDGALYSQHKFQSFNDFAANSKGSFSFSGQNAAGTVCKRGTCGAPPNCGTCANGSGSTTICSPECKLSNGRCWMPCQNCLGDGCTWGFAPGSHYASCHCY